MSAAFKARKRFGQNFLVDEHAAERIVGALAPAPGQAVLEIGPGHGELTSTLIERAGRIAAVELDRDLARELRRRFPAERLTLFEEDVLRLDFSRVLAALSPVQGSRLALVGNLPYNVSKPVALKLVDERERIDRAVLMFQREVARRLTARCGERDYAPLGILVGFAFELRELFHLPPTAFRPRPSVVSTVTLWVPRPAGTLDRHEAALRTCLKASFAHRRRTLFNNLRAAMGEEDARALLEGAGLDGGLRPGAIPPEGYHKLAELWPSRQSRSSRGAEG